LEDVREPFAEILSNGRITNFGKYVSQFEAETAAFLGVPTVAVSSGTMGLLFTLKGLGVGDGRKVILPSFTFMATAQAVLLAGGVPVFAEIDDDMNLSPADLDCLLRRHDDVAAVIPVHMYGLPARVPEIKSIVSEASARAGRHIPVIYDAAHGFGASVDGERVGAFGDAEIFSLSVTKVLVSVEGGLVASHDADLIARIKHMRNYGILSNYNAYVAGMNGKMSEFHAIVGLHNLRRVECLMTQRQERARAYRERIESSTAFRLVSWPANVVHTFKDFTITVPQGWGGAERDAVIQKLAARGVETRAYFFPPVHEQEYFRGYTDRALPRTEALARSVITLPFFTTITAEEMDYVAEQLRGIEKEMA
jgi:dTDP-4-amino-4,6-dideoxygalactose transaminase